MLTVGRRGRWVDADEEEKTQPPPGGELKNLTGAGVSATFGGSHSYFPANYFLSPLTDALLEVTSVWSRRTTAC